MCDEVWYGSDPAGKYSVRGLLQSRSLTCDVNQIYDGSYYGKLAEGSGVFVQVLKAAGYQVIDAEDVEKYL